jgi:hypothetical protein
MEAPLFGTNGRCAIKFALSLGLLAVVHCAAFAGAGYRTQNFTVDAPTPQLAKEIGDFAEKYRKELAIEWLGKELPAWSKPCPIKARVEQNLGAGGATSFVFDRGEVFGWRMDIQGSRERILDSVLPHEITHTIFACHFRQPLPRWADEGACTTVEHHSEISKQENMLIEFLQTRRGIRFDEMFKMTEYPQDVLPLYAQGHSLAHFLISQYGKQAFLEFIADGLTDRNWPRAIKANYGYADLLTLQNSWLGWVKEGRPQLQLASNAKTRGTVAQPVSAAATTVVRGQDPDSVAKSGGWVSVGAAASRPTPNRPAEQREVAAAPAGPSVYEALSSGASSGGQVRR